MKERNAYTYFLAAIGCTSIIVTTSALFFIDRPWDYLLTALAISLLGLFPIRLPNRFWYTFDHISALYIVIVYDWKLAIIPSMICMLSLALKGYFSEHRDIKLILYRFLVTIGSFTFSIYVTGVIYYSFSHFVQNTIILVTLLTIIIDLISNLLNKSIQVSILGWSVLSYNSFIPSLFPTVFCILSSTFLYRLYLSDSFSETLLEVSICSLTIYILSIVAKIAVDQKSQSDELLESLKNSYTSTRQIFIHLDLHGKILSSNTIAEQTIGLSNSSMSNQSIWNYVVGNSHNIMQCFDQAIAGISGEINLTLQNSENQLIPVQVSFVPHFRNKQVAGIFLVGRLWDLSICPNESCLNTTPGG
ncbi:hypothetical protein [Gorillibacterium sp. sgz5001074]|uniref:hypothetical protein n=1 Tax=Gorillibacterium sp. sgz5001074 TaxID=3446695 RepID=UPI003F665DE0